MDNEYIGALWLNEGKNGKKYMAGNVKINDVLTKIIVFKNNKKTADNQPDYNILISRPKQQESAPQASQQQAVENVFVDDNIPF